MSEKKKKNRIKKAFIKILFIMLLLLAMYILYFGIYKQGSIKDIFADIEEEEAIVSEYIVYGTHLNIEGSLSISASNIKSVKLAFRTLDDETVSDMAMTYTTNANGIKFTTSELINEGIDLEEMPENTYYMFVKVEYQDETVKYYSLKDNTDYSNNYLEYYTITKNSKNNKITIKFANYNGIDKTAEYMYMNVREEELPDDVYDIVIDPGHGGTDVGAVYGSYTEAELTLKIAKQLKEELEALGLKVKLTRDGTEGDEYTVYTVYDEDGRVNVVGNSKAKYVFSIHLNSIEEVNSQNGVEIYAPTKASTDFAKSLADNIVKYASTRLFWTSGRL